MTWQSGTTTGRHALGRRGFVRLSALGALGALGARGASLAAAGSASEKERERRPSRVAFNTANLVARVSGYHYELAHWMDQHRKTVAATDEAAWRSICREIADAGFTAVEIWEAHASPESLTEARAAEWKRALKETGLEPVAYAGRLRRETLEVCRWLGIPHVDGGIGELKPDEATALCREFGIRFNVENHPEKTAAEILAKVDGGNEWLGVCIDTGWLGTQGAPGPETIRACGSFVRHTHIKDVRAVGAHETCLLGEGIADPAGCIATLRAIGYTGWYSWEDEPEDRNPMESAVRNRRWIEERLRA
jgi:L-ribulose-5-phosphate 3-epimerase